MEQVDLGQMAQEVAGITAINPLQRVRHCNSTTARSSPIDPICRYFEELHPEPPLFARAPRTPPSWSVAAARRTPSARSGRARVPQLSSRHEEMEVPQVPAWAEATSRG